MRLQMLVRAVVTLVAIVAAALPSSSPAADIVLTPPAGGAVRFTDSAGGTTRFRIAEEGTVTINGNILKGADRFLYAVGTNNTFLGLQAGNFTMTGADNTGTGVFSLRANGSGYSNTATGRGALFANTAGYENTAHGTNALHDNTLGFINTAVGNDALFNNTIGARNVATGAGALYANTEGSGNTALGAEALRLTTTGTDNTAVGDVALYANTTGIRNVAIGHFALRNSRTGSGNVAIGTAAMQGLSSGSNNIAIGNFAGTNAFGSDNILLGADSVGGEDATMRLGNGFIERTYIRGIRGTTTGNANAIPVMIDSNGQLGTVSSSARFKDDIADMDDASSGLMKLRPVTFHYLADQDPAGRTLQYGLVAEEVAEVYPGLVARTPDGQVETVMHQFLPSMLLNEIQKQQRKIDRLEAKLAAIEKRLGTQGELR